MAQTSTFEAIVPRELKPALLELDGISRESIEAHYKLYEGYVNKRNEILRELSEVDLGAANPASTPARSLTSSDATSAGTSPFSTSTTIVGTPSFQPIARQTFVAPIECDPTRRMSIPRKMRTSQYPVGIDPAR